MKKRVVHGLYVVIGTIILFTGCLFLFNSYLDSEIERMYSEQYEYEYGNKSDYVLKKSVNENNLIILGSSELASPVEQNPVKMFPNSELDVNLTIDGQPYVQSLLQAMNMASLGETSDELKTAVIVSLQWFGGEDIDISGFTANFSELQFYNLIFNKKISDENKRYICKRVSELLENSEGHEEVKVYSALYKSEDIPSNVMLIALQPYYKVKYELLKFQDKYEFYCALKSTKKIEKASSEILEIDWEAEWTKAEQQGEKSCTNNSLYVEDEYYSMYIADKIDELKGVSSSASFDSKERDDFIHFLSICNDLDITPYVIMMNTNGYYYDYIGVEQTKRVEVYSWVAEQCEKYGIDCLTLEDEEYEPYFMHDAMHLGWKGWLFVNEKISEYFSDN